MKINKASKQAGFSLIELLIIIFIVGVVLSIATVAWKGFYQKLQFKKTTQTIVQEIYRVRSDARRSSDDITLSWNATNNQLLITNGLGNTLRTINLPDEQVTIPTGSGSIVYTAPFGRVTNTSDQQIRLDDGHGNISEISIIGVTGKVYQRSL